MRNLMLYLCGALLLSACNPLGQQDGAKAAQAMKAADAALQKALADKNLDDIIGFYAEDAVLLPTAQPIVVGKAAIRAEWQHILSIPEFENRSSTTRIEVASGADLAYSMGTYLATMLDEDGGLAMEPGKWLSVWKPQADGAWRIVVEMYNTDIPPPDHK